MAWNVSGKLVLVTGATSGIGLATAIELARRGAHVIAVGRDEQSAAGGAEAIRLASGSDAVDAVHADLSNQAAVRALVATVADRYRKLDVLLNNAGVALFSAAHTTEGIDVMLAVNHLAPFALTVGLLPIMQTQPEARVVTVTSDQYVKVKKFPWKTVEAAGIGVDRVTYEHTKLMNVWFTQTLAAKLRGTTVTATCVAPGFVNTALSRHARGGFGFFLRHLAPVFQSSPDQGAQTSVFACSAAELSGVTGAYLQKSAPQSLTGLANDSAQAARLWTVSERLCDATDRSG